MNKIIFLTLLFAMAINGLAETTPAKPIAIAIVSMGGPRRTLANNIIGLLTANLSADEHFALVDRDELKKVLDEQALGKSGNITPDSAAKIGQLTGAKVIITGREFNASSSDIMVIANIIGAENGRVFSATAQGSSSNLVDLIANLSQKIAQIIVTQSTNLIPAIPVSHEKRIAEIIKLVQGDKRPTVSIKIKEQMPKDSTTLHTAQTELGLLFQKAGFTVMDENSDTRADVNITGDAIFTAGQKTGSMFSGRAILELKAQQRKDGKIISLERQEASAADPSETMAAHQALQNATDDLAERLLPALAQ